MREVDRRLASLAERQHGVFTREQARRAGLSSSAISHRIKSGSFVECGTSTVHLPGATLGWYGRLTTGLLDLGPEGRITGRSASQLMGLDTFDGDALEFLVPRALRNRTTVGTLQSTSSITPADLATVRGFPCTSATRTIVQLLRTASLDEVGDAFDGACRMRLTAIPVVRRRLAELGYRDAAATFERLVAVGAVESWLERRFIDTVRSAGLPVPELQKRHQLEGVGTVRVDFEYPLWGIVVEVGGRRGYLSRDERQHKERRRNALQLDGRTTYFFTRHDVVDDPGYVVATLTEALTGRGSAPVCQGRGTPG